MGKGGKQTIGYKHYLGLHAVFCLGPIDKFTRFTVDDREAWRGDASGGQITVSAEKLFGGDEREGGVSGLVDIEMGANSQPKNAYLLANISANIPAYRGVAAMVFRDFYWGNNPYLKPARARGQRIHTAQDGALQWYDAKAAVGPYHWGDAAFDLHSGQVVLLITANVALVDESPAAHTLNPTGGVARSTINPECGDGNILFPNTGNIEIAANSDFLFAGGDFTVEMKITPLDAAAAFAGVWTVSFVGGRSWVLDSGSGSLRFIISTDGSNSTTLLDCPLPLVGVTTEICVERSGSTFRLYKDGVMAAKTTASPVLFASTAPFCLGSIAGFPSYYAGTMDNVRVTPVARYDSDGGYAPESCFTGFDMNPAHIIRECLTNSDWGMGYTADDVDDVSFTAAADTLYNEAMGISLVWDEQVVLESFINEIVRHIDAALFVSRSTGKFTLRLMRDDYVLATLPHFDESNIDKIANPSRPAFGELINSVAVQFWNLATGRSDSLTVQDPAGVQQQGVVINTTAQYQGFTNPLTAQKAAARDLRALSNPFLACTIYTGEAARALEVGDVIKVSWAKWHVFNLPMRITGFAMAEGLSNSVRLNVVEDVFSTPLNAVLAPPAEGWVDPSQPPMPPVAQLGFEVPYYELAQNLGQTAVDARLATDAALGMVGVAAVRSDNSIHARMWTDAGAGFTSAGVFDFCPSGLLTTAIGPTTTEATLGSFEDLDLITDGTYFQIEDELCRIDAVDPATGQIEFGRGVLDTVPASHPLGARAFFWDAYAGADPTEYADGESVDVRATPISGAGVLDLSGALESTVTLDARAFRPYPPGNLRINADSYPAGPFSGDLTLTWADRDRLLQTAGTLQDYTYGNIGPEAGTTYRVRGYLDGVLVHTEEPAVSGTTWTPSAEGLVRVEADSKRDGVYSWQAATHSFEYFSTSGRLTEEGDALLTEDGFTRTTED